MRAETHVVVFQLLLWAIMVVGFGAYAVMCILSLNLLYMLMVAGAFGLVWLVIWYLPVPCPIPGCYGLMRKSYGQISCFKDRVHYQCANCGHTFEKDFVSLFGRITITQG